MPSRMPVAPKLAIFGTRKRKNGKVSPPSVPGMPSSEYGANGRRPTAATSPGLSFFLGKSFSKRKMTPRTYIATTRATSPIGNNLLTSSGASCSTSSGPKDAANISTANTPSRGSCSKLGRP
ncbi:unnamed protein product [Sphagnum troendelagicum]